MDKAIAAWTPVGPDGQERATFDVVTFFPRRRIADATCFGGDIGCREYFSSAYDLEMELACGPERVCGEIKIGDSRVFHVLLDNKSTVFLLSGIVEKMTVDVIRNVGARFIVRVVQVVDHVHDLLSRALSDGAFFAIHAAITGGDHSEVTRCALRDRMIELGIEHRFSQVYGVLIRAAN